MEPGSKALWSPELDSQGCALGCSHKNWAPDIKYPLQEVLALWRWQKKSTKMVSIEEGKKEMAPTISGKAEGGLKDGVSWLESKDAVPRKTMAFRITLYGANRHYVLQM